MSPHRGGGLRTQEVEEQQYTDLEEIIQDIRENGWEIIKKHHNIYETIQLDEHDSKYMKKEKKYQLLSANDAIHMN